jgi:hypothetical protein
MFSSLHRLRTSLCRRKTQRYLCTQWSCARICSLAPAHCVTYIGKVMNREMGNTGALVSQPQTFITRPYLYGLFRRERRTSAARGKAQENEVSPAEGERQIVFSTWPIFILYGPQDGKNYLISFFCASSSPSTKDAYIYIKKTKQGRSTVYI